MMSETSALGGNAVERELERRHADHSLVGGVDQHRGAGERRRSLDPWQDPERPAKFARQRLRSRQRAVDQADVAGAAVDQAHQHGAGAAAGADHHDRALVRAPIGFASRMLST